MRIVVLAGRLLFWGALAATVWLSVKPSPATPRLAGMRLIAGWLDANDFARNVVCFFVLGFLGLLHRRLKGAGQGRSEGWTGGLTVLGAILGLAVALEGVQSFLPRRTPDVMDVAAAAVGLALSMVVFAVAGLGGKPQVGGGFGQRRDGGRGKADVRSWLVWGINYRPEVTGIAPFNGGMCEYLAERGHEVRMVSTFPYYPNWRKEAADSGRLYRRDCMNGVVVERCWHFVPRRPRAWSRILHEASFAFSSTVRVLTLPRPDVCVVVSPPLGLGFVAWLVMGIRGVPFVFHVQDLQPDAALGLGMLKEGPVLRLLFWLERLAYRKAACVTSISPGIVSAIRAKGIPSDKVQLFPNWVEIPSVACAAGLFRRRNGYAASDFLVVYSGNLGMKQGIDQILDAAGRLADPRVRVLIVGDGAARARIEARVAQEGLSRVRLFPLLPQAEFEELVADSDLCLIPQQPGAGRYFFPSKLLTLLARSKAVMVMSDPTSELAEVMAQERFGIHVDPSDTAAVVAAWTRLASEPALLRKYEQAGRRYVERFERSVVLSEFERMAMGIARRGG